MQAGPERIRIGETHDFAREYAARRPSTRMPRLIRVGLSVPGVLFVALIVLQGVAAGATSVRTYTPERYSVTHVGAPTAAAATVTATGDLRVTPFLAGLGAGGTQGTSAPGVDGTPLALPSCALAACRDRYTVASPAGLVAGDYAEDVQLAVTQPSAATGASSGFLIELVVETSTGWTAGRAYLATGTSTRAAGATLTVLVYLNLGTATAPTILKVYSQVDRCSAATACP